MNWFVGLSRIDLGTCDSGAGTFPEFECHLSFLTGYRRFGECVTTGRLLHRVAMSPQLELGGESKHAIVMNSVGGFVFSDAIVWTVDEFLIFS